MPAVLEYIKDGAFLDQHLTRSVTAKVSRDSLWIAVLDGDGCFGDDYCLHLYPFQTSTGLQRWPPSTQLVALLAFTWL